MEFGFNCLAMFIFTYSRVCLQVDPKKSFPRPKLIDGQTKVSGTYVSARPFCRLLIREDIAAAACLLFCSGACEINSEQAIDR